MGDTGDRRPGLRVAGALVAVAGVGVALAATLGLLQGLAAALVVLGAAELAPRVRRVDWRGFWSWWSLQTRPLGKGMALASPRAAASPDVIERIESELGQSSGVRQVIHTLTQHLGPDELLVAATVEFDLSLSGADLAGAIDACEARIRAAVPIATVVCLEPDLCRD